MADVVAARAEIERQTKAEEGWSAKPYLCTARVPSIGYGCTTYEDGSKVKLSDAPITRERGQQLLDFKLDEGIRLVLDMTHGEVGTNQLIALVVCGFNIGWPGLRGSTMIKAHNRGDFAAAGRAFALWNNSRPGGPGTPLKEDKVLTARRAREAAIYRLPDDHDQEVAVAVTHPTGVPQAVEPESSLAKSRIAQGGGVISLASAVAAVKDWGEQAEGVRPALASIRAVVDFGKDFMANTLGITGDPAVMLPYAGIALGLGFIYYRYTQRRGGWA